MASITEAYERARSFNARAVIENAFEATKDELIRVNQSQLYEGRDRSGNRLKKYRNERYARKKNRMNGLPGLGNPDFYVTGAFYSGWKLKIEGGNIITELGDSKKADFLLNRDPLITGLGGDYKSRFVSDSLRPAYLSKVHEELKL